MLNLLIWTVLGMLSGWVLALLYTTNKRITGHFIIIGIIGAVIAGLTMQYIRHDSLNHYSDFSVLVAVVGAVALLSMIKKFKT